jgi:lipoprotein-anchoring transpeptidase ErfK/SrfK
VQHTGEDHYLQLLSAMKFLARLCCLLCFTSTLQAGPAPVVNEVLAAQVALDRAGFSPGEIDGRSGQNLQRALTAFQKEHQMPTTGQLDDATWKQLTEAGGGAQPPLVEYAITDADIAGPFTTNIPPTLPEQASLDALNYRSPLEAIAERVHSSMALLQRLNPQATFQRTGERIMVPNVGATAPAAAPSGAITVFVTKSSSALTIEDAGGHVLLHAPVTSGSEHDPLPIGTWKVNGVQRNPRFHYNPDLFWDATPGDSKAMIPPGPNNPVGVLWIDLSKPHYGIHGTPEPSKIGHVESHGCVRLTNWDAERVAQWVKPGTRVVFRQ